MATGAPGKINDYSRLQIEALTTNQVVGSSNLSGRATLAHQKRLGDFILKPFFLSAAHRMCGTACPGCR